MASRYEFLEIKQKTVPRDHPGSLLLAGRFLGGLGDLASFALRFLDRLDDPHGHRLLHVTDGETSERGIFRVSLHTHWLGRDQHHDGGVSALDELGIFFEFLSAPAVDLFLQFGKLAGNVGGVAIEHGGVAGVDMTGMI